MKLNALEFALMNNPLRAALQRRLETPLLLAQYQGLAGQRVLEIGCGRGVGIEILLARGARQVVGFDLDLRMVARARRRVLPHSARAQVFVGSADTISAPDRSYDAVVDYGIIHHVPDWRQVLAEVARVLRPGGVFFFEDILQGFTTRWPIRRLFAHPQATQFSAAAFRAGLVSAGLEVERWRLVGAWIVMGQARKAP